MSRASPVARIRAQALAKIEQDKGRLTPEDVVEAAQAESHELHDCFTWDDTECGKLYRLDQARGLIREVKVQIVSRDIVMVAPFYVSDPNPNRQINGYVQLAPLRRKKDDARRIINDEIGRIEGALTRARAVAAVLGLEDDLDAMVVALVGLRGKLDDAA